MYGNRTLSHEGRMSLISQHLGCGAPQSQARKRPAVRGSRSPSIPQLRPQIQTQGAGRAEPGEGRPGGTPTPPSGRHTSASRSTNPVRTPLLLALSGVQTPPATSKDTAGRRDCPDTGGVPRLWALIGSKNTTAQPRGTPVSEPRAWHHVPSGTASRQAPRLPPQSPPHFAWIAETPMTSGWKKPVPKCPQAPQAHVLLRGGKHLSGLAELLKDELCRPLEPQAGCAGRSSGRRAPGPPPVTQTYGIVIARGSGPAAPTAAPGQAAGWAGRSASLWAGPGPSPASALHLQPSSISQNTKYKKVADRMWLPTARAPGRGETGREPHRAGPPSPCAPAAPARKPIYFVLSLFSERTETRSGGQPRLLQPLPREREHGGGG